MTRRATCRSTVRGVVLLASLALWPCVGRADAGRGSAEASTIRAIVRASGITGGLVVVVGCDEPKLLTDIQDMGPYLVHGLDTDPRKVAAARLHLQSQGRYGPIAVSRLQDRQLPFANRLVNLLMIRDATCRLADEEIRRALTPGGAVVDPYRGTTVVSRKPWPEEIDEWSHFLHDPTNNAVSEDREVAPLQGLRWTCGPKFARSHEHFASVSAMVTAGGRLFYIIDEGPTSSVYLPSAWKLVARDAFSGVLLWKKPIANWESRLRGFRSGPPEIGRLLVAGKDRVYTSPGYGQPVTVLDAATGRTLATLAGTGGARELILSGGVLYVLADDMTAADHEKRKEQINRIEPTLKIWYRFPRKALPMYGRQRIVAAKAGKGALLWKKGFEAPGEVMPTTMAVDGGRLCVQTTSHVVCLDAAKGKELWRSRRPVATSRLSWSTPSLVISRGVVLTIDRLAKDNADKTPPTRGSKWLISSGGREVRQDAELVAFSLADGKELWRAPYMENYNVPQDIFVIGGVVWVGNVRRGVDKGFTQGRDLKTGKVVTTIPPQKGWGHHRCYRNKATVRWILMGRGGTQFVDPRGGPTRHSSWVRGGCQYGIMPANGLVYTPPHSCACSPEVMQTGLNALSPLSNAGQGGEQLERGPAYGNVSAPRPAAKANWPTYRRDARRSGFQDLPAPVNPAVTWTAKLTPPLTAPVSADGKVFVAERDRHALHAISASDGKSLWTFLADGRIDSPPTLCGGLCLFGTRSGMVYCLRARDGALVWRFRAAPQDRRIFAYGQLESPWPVHGAVLVDDTVASGRPRAYFAAGRSPFTDGGIRLYSLDPQTGKRHHQRDVTFARRSDRGVIRERVLPDILSAEKGAVWMRGLGVDAALTPVKDQPHLFAPRGFLDDTWWHRTYWVYGTEIGGGYTHWPDVGNRRPAGRLLVLDGGKWIYGYGRLTYAAGKGHVGADLAKGYKLFAEDLTPAPAAARRRGAVRRFHWTVQPPFVVRSIVLARDALLISGGSWPGKTAAGGEGGAFWVVSREDGSRRAGCKLPAPPVLDGMALTDAGVFLSGTDGTVLCLRAAKRK